MKLLNSDTDLTLYSHILKLSQIKR